MGTALVALQAGSNPVEFATSMGLAYCAVVGCTPDQGAGVALAGYCEGLDPVAFKRRYHWIPGKGPSMRADAMLAEFTMNWGGKYKLIESSPTRCAITFTDAEGNTYERVLTRTDLLLSRNPWKGGAWKEWVPKVQAWIAAGQTEDQIMAQCWTVFGDNYGTPFDWENMLMARLVSQSLRKICPGLVAGIYTPEEMEDVEVVSTKVEPPRKSVDQLLAEQKPVLGHRDTIVVEPAKGDDTPAPFEDVADGDFEPAVEKAATEGQTARLLALFEKVWPGDQAAIDKVLSKRNVSAVAQLSPAQAKELIDKLEATFKANPT
jgi:hypothetical protein